MEAEKEELGFIKIHHCFMAIGSAFGKKELLCWSSSTGPYSA